MIFGMLKNYRFSLIAAFVALVAVSTAGAETAILKNGFTIHCERREAKGELTRLYLSDSPDSFVDVRTSEIASFEEDGIQAAPARTPSFQGSDGNSIEEAVSASSSRNNVSPNLIRSVIRAESGFNPSAISPKGAQGLMQLMPQTAARLGVQDAFDPADNVEGGTRYLKQLLGLYHNDVVKALAAYNAGPERVQRYKGIPPYPETIAYVNRVIKDFNRQSLVETNIPRMEESFPSFARHPLTTTAKRPGVARSDAFSDGTNQATNRSALVATSE